ncbi:MAG: two component system sensor protein [Desulfobacteraceae bacterium]|nr:two component system sensor protein [Desulfobacteraceae bacterium]
MRAFPVNIIVPVILTLILFIMVIFLVVLPLLEKNLMNGKRQTIMRLTEMAWSSLYIFHDHARRGMVSEDTAKKTAIRFISQVRYGPDFKDYLWVIDMVPVMIMHPYRPDLDGQNVSRFKDSNGTFVFSDMVKIVKEHKDKAGFVNYLWQWEGDPTKIELKISYVKLFKPWGWIIGTGIYVDDVKAEIQNITHKLIWFCVGLMGVVLLLSAYVIWAVSSVKKERQKALVQSRLREKQMIQADKMSSLGILVAGVAHEINNPATFLMLNAPNLKKAWYAFIPILDTHFNDNPTVRVCNMTYLELRKRIELMLSGIQDGSARIKEIISELKDFTRSSDARMDYEVDVNQVVAKSMDLTSVILKKSTFLLSVEYGENLPRVRGNFGKLQQVMINLLVNAGQALEHSDQSIHVLTRLSDHKGFLIIEVIDTGPGITQNDLKKMKDPFFTTRRDEGGTGLGLSISEKIISDHSGVLEFSSPPGQGLTARIILPCVQK